MSDSKVIMQVKIVVKVNVKKHKFFIKPWSLQIKSESQSLKGSRQQSSGPG